MRIAVGADHIGLPLKQAVVEFLRAAGHEAVDFGVLSTDPVDYPDVAEVVADEVAKGAFTRAVLVCGTGIGMAIAANKVAGVRAATASDPYSAARSRMSNDCQVLCLGSRVITAEVAQHILETWLAAEFQGGRSAPKVAKLIALDQRRKDAPVTGLAQAASGAADPPAGS